MGWIAGAMVLGTGATMIAANQSRRSGADNRRDARGDIRMALDEWLRSVRAVKSRNVKESEALTYQLQKRAEQDLKLGTELDDVTMNMAIQQARMSAAQKGMGSSGRAGVEEAMATLGLGQQMYQQRIQNAGMAAQLGQSEMQYLLSGLTGQGGIMGQTNMYTQLAMANQAASGQAMGSAFGMFADLYSAKMYNNRLAGDPSITAPPPQSQQSQQAPSGSVQPVPKSNPQ